MKPNQPNNHLRIVGEWLTSLGIATAASMTLDEARMRTAAILPLLAERFPTAAFSKQSLEHVAAQSIHGFPVYAEMCRLLAEYWREHRQNSMANAIHDEASRRTPFEEQQLRQAELMREWDNPTAIRDHVEDLRNEPILLNLLRAAVNKFAPQHAHLIPP